MYNFIHIPKNGGTSLQKVIKNIQTITYRPHRVDPKTVSNTIIIVRDPVDRFCSAIRYAMEIDNCPIHLANGKLSFGKTSQTQLSPKFKNIGITQPEDIIQILLNPEHENYQLADNLIKNIVGHRIGNKHLTYRWTFTSQKEWIHKPQCVILFENLEEEFSILFSKLGYPNVKLPHSNKTHNNTNPLSESSIKFLKEFYHDDFELYHKYKQMSLEERLNKPDC